MNEKRTVKIQANVHTNKKFIEVDGALYALKKKSVGKGYHADELLEFVEVDKKDYEETVTGLAKKLSDRVKIVPILEQALRELSLEELFVVKKELEKPKPMIRNYSGCSILKVGKSDLFLRD